MMTMRTPFGLLVQQLRLATTTSRGRVYANGPVRWRLSGPISQNELARRAGIDPSYVHMVERGMRTTPSRPVVERLARALELDDVLTVRLLVAAGYWPFPELDDDATDLALAVILGIGNGDWRILADHDTARVGQPGRIDDR